MAIQFNCPQCGHLLQTPDGTEGKKARCPSCSEVVDVPAAVTPPPNPALPDDGFGTVEPPRKPFSSAPIGKEEFNPFASPASSSFADRPELPSTERNGPPWENPGPAGSTFIETIKLVIMQPTQTYRTMNRTGGLGRPLFFSLAAQMVGFAVTMIYQVIFQGGMFMMGGAGQGGNGMPGAPEMAVGLGMVLALTLIAMPIGVILGTFVWSGILHLFLMLFRGANFPYETTFRTICYGYGAWGIVGLVPCVGPYVAGIGGLVSVIIGLIHMHDTTAGKSIAACLSPMAVCCGLYLVLIVVVIASVGFAN